MRIRKEPLWHRRDWVNALHIQPLKRFGGLHGFRGGGAVESALVRPELFLARGASPS